MAAVPGLESGGLSVSSGGEREQTGEAWPPLLQPCLPIYSTTPLLLAPRGGVRAVPRMLVGPGRATKAGGKGWELQRKWRATRWRRTYGYEEW